MNVYRTMEAILEKIKDFADRAHGEQTRRYTPERYIVHPIRVMNICKEYTDDITMLAAALLHDVLEDTPVDKKEISAFLLSLINAQQAEKTILLVEELTDVYIKDRYPGWNRRKRKTREAQRLEKISSEAQTIKYADILDNSLEIVKYDLAFARQFLAEGKVTLNKMTKGNPQLYQRTLTTVNECLAIARGERA